MEEAIAARYWCHMCSQMVNPIMEVEMKCPFCQSGFVEEMSNDNQNMLEADFESGRALSLWAPILLGMMGNPHHRLRLRRIELDDDGGDGGETEYDSEIESILRRRRRNSTTILQLLQGIRAGLASDSSESDDSDRERERVTLINPFNQTIIVQGSYGQNEIENHRPIGSLGDYFIGHGLELFLQHLAENDPNRYGTPPAQKEAIEALPTVTINENLQCSVCLGDFGVGSEAKEMPCKHRFHSGCILPWLELHSSCPVCRSQLPVDVDVSKRDSDMSRNSSNQSRRENEDGDGEGRNGSGGTRFSFPWPFNALFSSSTSSSSSSRSITNRNGTESEDNWVYLHLSSYVHSVWLIKEFPWFFICFCFC